jgi:hypothetical protein
MLVQDMYTCVLTPIMHNSTVQRWCVERTVRRSHALRGGTTGVRREEVLGVVKYWSTGASSHSSVVPESLVQGSSSLDGSILDP